MVSEVTDATFETDVLQADRPVVVDFWAPWCGPCRVVSPIIDDLAGQHGERVSFLKLNVDDNPATASRYNVLSIPTVILF
jgi:thioredoxin 1